MNIWIDIKNSHEPLFFKTLISNLKYNFQVTSRSFGEVQDLLNLYKIPHQRIGGRSEGSMFFRKLDFIIRVLRLLVNTDKFDVSLSHSSIWAVYASYLKGKKTISFSDNEISSEINKSHFKYLDFLFYPDCIPKETLLEQGILENNLVPYPGYKEDIYVSSYKPDPYFLENLPFKNYVVIRPESNQAFYVKNKKSIVRSLITKLLLNGFNIVYLPRYKSHHSLINDDKRIYIPKSALNGLDLCYYSQGVATGAGTLSREAACLGKPAISFFPEKEMLSVDKSMIKNKFVIHSRNPDEIIFNLKNSSNFRRRSKENKTLEYVLMKLKQLLE